MDVLLSKFVDSKGKGEIRGMSQSTVTMQMASRSPRRWTSGSKSTHPR
jgi:hypothetical protein